MNGSCGICGSPDRRAWRRQRDWVYMECMSCSAAAMDPFPSPEWSESFYDVGYFRGGGRDGYLDYTADEPQHRINARNRIRRARRFGATAALPWLDVGCAVGYTLDEARQAGFDTHGVELSEWAGNMARDRFGLRVERSLREVATSRCSEFGVVSFFQVLEHLPDPVGALKEARSCLQPGGLIIVETWDRGSTVARAFGNHWQQIAPPSVLWIFDRPSLHDVLKRCALKVVSIERTSKAISLGWATGLLADKAPAWARAGLRRLAASPLGRVDINYRLGDLITVVATT